MIPLRKLDRAPTMSEALAAALRPLSNDDFVTPASNASPALVLQARLERAVLASFEHAPAEPRGRGDTTVFVIVVSAALFWAAALGTALAAFG